MTNISTRGNQESCAPQQTEALPPSEVLVHSVPVAGKMLGLGKSAAYAAAKNGQLPVIRIGGRLLVPHIALLRLLESATV